MPPYIYYKSKSMIPPDLSHYPFKPGCHLRKHACKCAHIYTRARELVMVA
jgi:hypothetical protein